ncbi:putative ABC multidrug transporter [Aureobasidium sp. EXF-3400]|nr:putative ABC multidrug transporter [Aureobasidium sp. EXF-12344]KAI4770107.1 putative ABC multidrug transporter [Aureobasidium sp. EXF-3400]
MNQAVQANFFQPDVSKVQTGTTASSSGRESSTAGSIELNKTAHHTTNDHSQQHDQLYEPIREGDDLVLQELARVQSQQRNKLGAPSTKRPSSDANTLNNDENDPGLDPTSGKFDLDKYLQKTLAILEGENMILKEADVVMENVSVSGSGRGLNFQDTVSGIWTAPFRFRETLANTEPKHILRHCNALLKHGELLVVLGRPGAGCSTFLKAMTGETHSLRFDKASSIHYSGIPQKTMVKEFKGEVIYNQEVDKHLPHLTVGRTLEHAAALRVPNVPLEGRSRKEMIKHMAQVIMAVYGLSHTYFTKVGNDFVRGVSGGERKRVSIAEMALACSPISAWDNSTRGLDSASALQFVKSLRQSSSIMKTTHAVAIYQASQSIYDLFDRAMVLYEGRQIFYGPASRAKAYFEDMGWECPTRQTTGDFLTSVTNPLERKARKGFESTVPRTPDEFEAYWQRSPEYSQLRTEIDETEARVGSNGSSGLTTLRAAKRFQQGKLARKKSPYVATIGTQIKMNLIRALHRALNDKASTLAPIATNFVMALIIGSVFYNTPEATAGFGSAGAVLFFAIVLNALAAIAEIASLYSQRPVVEKHKSYAFYHPWTEAMAGFLMDIPLKFCTTLAFDIVIYFMAGLRAEAGKFFIFLLVTYMITFIMAAVFRIMAALTKTISQAMALAGVLILAITNYTGYSLPIPYMHPWFSWIRYINPVQYAFEMLIANQFHGKNFTCSAITPAYSPPRGDSWICSSTGAVAGQDYVNGDLYIADAYEYSYSHMWRNLGILFAFLIAFCIMYFFAVELNSSTTSTAESLVFRRGRAPDYLLANQTKPKDEEAGEKTVDVATEVGTGDLDMLPAQRDIYTWHNVVYDIEIKGEPRRLLDHVSGWVKPGTLTALMGSSGAGKTTLLDALAQRTTMGVITGDMFVNGNPLDRSFQRKTGYVQQQDLHLETSTVRESLRFSAVLRQPKSVSKKEKYEYVENVIQMLGMQDFAEAIVGVPGQGLNVEQRKLLTIGVELAARPKLLLFLDEPTSGLDSQSSWAICAFLRKLADHGQAVLCTIHQPSAVLFQQFDRLLFLKKGGQMVYFGEVGRNSRTLLDYFEKNGARKCEDDENPAEYMLDMVTDPNVDWHEHWKNSPEFAAVKNELHIIYNDEKPNATEVLQEEDSLSEFAMPFFSQLSSVTTRVFQQYWRTPSYIYAKFMLCIAAGLFIGFSFYDANVTQQGMQNVLYSLFMVASIFSTVVQQIQPYFVTQRDLYEVRERPSKAYSWKAFILAQMVVELPYQIISGLLMYGCFFFPVVGIPSSERQVLVMLLCIALFIYASTFAHMLIAALPNAETAAAFVVLLFAMSLIFCGVIQSPTGLPGFWIFMYRVSFFTYWVKSMAAAMLWGRPVTCAATELSVFDPPSGLSCGTYLEPYLQMAPGRLLNPSATRNCSYCALSSADQYLSADGIEWSDRWGNFGYLWVYIVFNVAATIALYWFFRARKMSGNKK